MDARTTVKKLFLPALFVLISFVPADRKTTVYLVGDSTMADKTVDAWPETGWGMPFHYFFDSTIVVDNRAKNGRSTRTFIEEGRWKAIMAQLQPGDYVLVQFGHNDEVPTKRSYTPPKQFTANLDKFVDDARSRGAFPVLITPVARRRFDSAGHIVETHAQYARLVRETAAKDKVPLIDLDAESQALLQQLGPETSKYFFNYLAPGENPHYPSGRADNTHFSELGARRMAEIVLHDLPATVPGLAAHIRHPEKAKK